MPSRYSASYPSEAKNVAIARSAVATFARSCGFSGAEVAEIEIAVGEALNNAAEHGRGREAGSFTVRCDARDDLLVIEVRDSGRGFKVAPLAPPEALPSKGYGMTIMRALMNQVSYSKNGTVVRLVRRRADTTEDSNGHSAG